MIIKPIDQTHAGYPLQVARVCQVVDEGEEPYVVAVLYCPLTKANKWPGHGPNFFGTWFAGQSPRVHISLVPRTHRLLLPLCLSLSLSFLPSLLSISVTPSLSLSLLISSAPPVPHGPLVSVYVPVCLSIPVPLPPSGPVLYFFPPPSLSFSLSRSLALSPSLNLSLKL